VVNRQRYRRVALSLPLVRRIRSHDIARRVLALESPSLDRSSRHAQYLVTHLYSCIHSSRDSRVLLGSASEVAMQARGDRWPPFRLHWHPVESLLQGSLRCRTFAARQHRVRYVVVRPHPQALAFLRCLSFYSRSGSIFFAAGAKCTSKDI
jgi:hypothetical protein